jgi:hypothetical protein
MRWSILVVVSAVIFAWGQTSYIVRDSSGRLLFETSDSMLVRAIKNAKIDTVVKEPEIARMYQVPKKMSDDLKSTLENLLGKPKTAEYNYKIEWANDSCGKIILMKPAKGTSVLFCNTKGAAWMKAHVVGIVE